MPKDFQEYNSYELFDDEKILLKQFVTVRQRTKSEIDKFIKAIIELREQPIRPKQLRRH